MCGLLLAFERKFGSGRPHCEDPGESAGGNRRGVHCSHVHVWPFVCLIVHSIDAKMYLTVGISIIQIYSVHVQFVILINCSFTIDTID